MMRSLFWKLFGLSVILILTLAAAVLLFSFRLLRVHTVDILARDLERQARLLEPRLLSVLENEPGGLNAAVRDIGARLEVRVTVIAPDGRVLADSEKDAAAMENHRFRPEVQDALERRPGRSTRYSRTLKTEMLYVGWPLIRDGKPEGVLRLSSFVRDIDSLMSGLRSALWKLAATLTLLAALGALWMSRSLTRPVRRMIQVSRRISKGDFQAKVYHSGRDELGELGRSLNSMTGQIGDLVENLRLQKEELNGLLESMQEALVLIAGDDRIRLSNDSFKTLIGRRDPEGLHYWEVIRSAAFADLMRAVRADERNRSEKIEIGERIYMCSATRLTRPERILVVLHDQTEASRIEQVKKDLVINMSHELRTPLAAVKGYLETLEDEVTPQGRTHLDIVRRNTDRLIRIVDDLLVLADLEGRETASVIERLDIKVLAARTLKLFELAAGAKGIGLRLEADDSPLWLEGDAFRLEQMFLNLLDNAVKHTDRGEVVLSIAGGTDRAVIQIRDTGIGIPPEHLPRLFERFYVVDPSRSRTVGGTGLGLAIVKHIALLHKGEVSVSSDPGRGTCFTVTLPLKKSGP
ncbi:MAG: HAMP domain-containing protein [Candidatus Aminicenantes bacterium]|nr:HAMP domain-containing protein [Candidatus Aminicenantes bacterium]